MAEYTESYEIIGPRGTKRGEGFVDTGASLTVVPQHVAEELGIEPYRPETVDTNNGPVRWGVGRADVSVGGKPAQNQDVFIAPSDNPLAIGAQSLQLNGFNLRAAAARARGARSAEDRLSICAGCPELIAHPYLKGLADRCAACGCLLAAKTRMPGERCPKGLW
jgi:predicted aspartyl protease